MKEGAPRSPARELYSQLETLSNAVYRTLERGPLTLLPEAPVTVEQMRVLRFVALNPDRAVGDLARRFEVSLASTSIILSRLAAKGLVARHTDSSDRRRVRLALTPAGQALVDRVDRELDARLEASVTRLGARHADQLAELIAELICSLSEAAERQGSLPTDADSSTPSRLNESAASFPAGVPTPGPSIGSVLHPAARG